MRVLIIEDEPATAKHLENMLKSLVADVVLDETIDTVEDSIIYFSKGSKPDLVFMDIHLADGNSFEIFEQAEVNCPVIFTTAYDQYAIKAFKVNSIDYLLKPIKKEELLTSLNKYQNTVSKNEMNVLDVEQVMEIFQHKSKPELKRLIVKIGPKLNAININDIAYFKIMNKAVYGVTLQGNHYPVDFTMEQLEEELNSAQFFRINRSFIVSFESIKSMLTYSKSRIKIELDPKCSEDTITSTERTASFKDWLKGKS